jgi:outer membrane protein TolC
MMKRNRLFYITVCLAALFSALASFAQEEEVKVITLKEAQDHAVKYSQDVALAGIEIEKANAQVQQAMAALLPQVSGNLSYTQYGKLPATIFPSSQEQIINNTFRVIEQGFIDAGFPLDNPISVDPSTIPDESVLQFGEKFNLNAEIMASQVVFNGVFLVGLQAAAAFVSIVEHQKELTEESIRDNVRRSYYRVLAANENVEILQRNIGNLASLFGETSALYQNGFAEEIDVDRLQLSLNNLNTQLEQAKRQVELTEAVLKFQMGMDIYAPIVLFGKLEDYMEDIDYNLPARGDFNRRTEISLFNERERVNEFNVKRYKSEYYPTLTAFSSLGSSAQREKFNFFRFNDDNSWFNTRYFGFEINVPIWDSFNKKGQVQYARLDLDRIRAEREKFFLSLDLEYEQAKTGLIEAKEQVDYASKNIELAQKIYDVSQIKYREGVGSSIEMTNSERDLYEAQANYLMAIYNLLIAKADIDKALGIYE